MSVSYGLLDVRVLQLTKKVPELMDELGLTDRALIQNNLVPLLNATERKFFAHEGKVVSQRDVAALNTRLNALDMAFRLRGSYAPKDPAEAAQFGVKVIIVDVPRPRYDLPDVRPGDPLPVIPPLMDPTGTSRKSETVWLNFESAPAWRRIVPTPTSMSAAIADAGSFAVELENTDKSRTLCTKMGKCLCDDLAKTFY